MALAKLLRGKLKAMLADKRPDLVAPAAVWAKPWVVHINHWGQGHDAVLRYLARYVFRIAITNTRIVALDDHTVTIRYQQRKSSRWCRSRMPGHEFIRRFLQHVLPKDLAQGPLFWPLAPLQTSARRSGTPPPGARTHNSAGYRTGGIKPSPSRRPRPRYRHRTAALSTLRPRPPRLHP
jgi:hypothetical protein